MRLDVGKSNITGCGSYPAFRSPIRTGFRADEYTSKNPLAFAESCNGILVTVASRDVHVVQQTEGSGDQSSVSLRISCLQLFIHPPCTSIRRVMRAVTDAGGEGQSDKVLSVLAVKKTITVREMPGISFDEVAWLGRGSDFHFNSFQNADQNTPRAFGGRNLRNC